jgi:hypothetical protein
MKIQPYSDYFYDKEGHTITSVVNFIKIFARIFRTQNSTPFWVNSVWQMPHRSAEFRPINLDFDFVGEI